ncbi:unnamed protein product [Caenorhabditis bovis]|uniref:EGF-like domain-containing protein n=1 Tax=Caenorhabditis bovis TaxID=2654633 RepID=A0A8S1F233_9PELO|nr:unnamed protein product [Caenorhabditis bovis]
MSGIAEFTTFYDQRLDAKEEQNKLNSTSTLTGYDIQLTTFNVVNENFAIPSSTPSDVISQLEVISVLSIGSLIAQKDYLINRGSSELNKIAAMTHGHYILANESIRSTNYGVTSELIEIVSRIADSSIGQELILAGNVLSTSIHSTLGSMISPHSNITVSLSLSAGDTSVPSMPSVLRIAFAPENGTSVTHDFLANAQYKSSNYYSADLTLVPGTKYIVRLIYAASGDNDLLLRVWGPKLTSQSAGFVHVDGKEENPDTINGAGLKFKIKDECVSEASIRITDCSGNVGTKYDAEQYAKRNDTENWQYWFVPYFCDNIPQNDCVKGTEGKYDIQISVGNKYQFTRSFVCAESKSSPEYNCRNKDALGNYQCAQNVAPFKRGPTGKLTDCSGHGRLVFNNIYEFKCECDDSFSGDSCEIGSCSSTQTDFLSIDTKYRTYTVIVGVANNYIEISLEDAKNVFQISNDNNNNIWKYQLIVYCNLDQVEVLYSGGDIAKFNKAFETRQADMFIQCKENDNTFDLTRIYNIGIQGVGNNVNGLLAFFTEEPKYVNVSLNEFIQVSQTYKQQLFVFTAPECDTPSLLPYSVVQATMSTGGFVIQSKIDENSTKIEYINKTFETILKGDRAIAFAASGYSESQISVTLEEDSIAYLMTWNMGGLIYFNKSRTGRPPTLDNDALCAAIKVNAEASTRDLKNSLECVMFTISTQLHVLGYRKVRSMWVPHELTNGNRQARVNISLSLLLQVFHKSSQPSSNYSAVVYVTNGVAPVAEIISDTNVDASDAVSTSTSNTRTKLAVFIPDGWKIESGDDDSRIANRSQCIFDTTLYSVLATDKYEVGANLAKIGLKKDGVSVIRYFPIATSQDVNCQNGGTPHHDTGSCHCSENFTGSDCSQVICDKSISDWHSNAWNNVCVCQRADDKQCHDTVGSMISQAS